MRQHKLPVNAAQIRDALARRFCAPEWAVFFEVAGGTGAHARRYADAVAMNLYPSRGFGIHGFEIKVHRSDWRRELKNPRKSVDVQRYCDHWWIVVPPDVVDPDELPTTWGLYHYKGGQLTIAKKAPRLEAQPLDRTFAAALLRRAGEWDQARKQAALNAETQALAECFERSARQQVASRTRRYEALLEKVQAFEKAAGLSIQGRLGTEEAALLGQQLSQLLLGYDNLPRALEQMENRATRILEQVQAARAEWDTQFSGAEARQRGLR